MTQATKPRLTLKEFLAYDRISAALAGQLVS